MAVRPAGNYLAGAAAGAIGAASAAAASFLAWIGDVTSYERRQPILARFMIGQVLGVSTGVLLGGYAADHLHWRTPFELIAVWYWSSGCYHVGS